MKKLFYAVCVAILSALFIFASTFLFQQEATLYEVSARICAGWKVFDPVAIQKFCVLIRYMVTISPLLWVYFISVLLPRVKGLNVWFTIISVIVLIFGSFISALVIGSVYYGVFEGNTYWNVDVYYSRIPMVWLNFISCIAAIVVMIWKIYRPNYKANNENWMKQDYFLHTLIRYGSLIVLAHLALIFAVAFKGVLIDVRLDSLPDFLATAESDSHYAFGLIFLLVAEPLLHELAFRGLIFEHLKKGMHESLAAIISSALYVIWYWHTGLGLYAFLFGMMLCYVYGKGFRLRYAILVHMLMNLLKVNFFLNGDQHFFKFFAWICAVEKHWIYYAAANSAFMMVISLLGIFLFVFIVHKNHAE